MKIELGVIFLMALIVGGGNSVFSQRLINPVEMSIEKKMMDFFDQPVILTGETSENPIFNVSYGKA